MLTALHDGSHDFAKLLHDAKKPMIIVGQAALARPDGAAVLAAAWRLAAIGRRADRRVARLQRAAHRGRARRRAWISASCPAPAASRWRRCWMAASMCCGCSAPTSSTSARIGANTFVVYQGHHGDAGARARRRDPARRGLHREARHLRQHRRPRAARLARGLSARRGARGLEDPARVQRDDRPHAAVRHAGRAARAAGAGEPGVRPHRFSAALRLHRPERARRRSGAPCPTRRSRRRSPTTTRPIRSAAPVRPWRRARRPSRPRRWSRRRNSAMHDFLVDTDVGHRRPDLRRGARAAGAAADRRRLSDLCRAQGPGGDAVAQGTERGRAVRPAAAVRRRAEDADEGDDHPVGREPAAVPDGADADLRPGDDRLGGDPGERRLGDRRHQCRHPVSVRDQLARRLRHHHRRLGVATRNTPSSARCAARRRW